MAAEGTVKVVFIGDAASLRKALADVSDSTEQASKSTEGFSLKQGIAAAAAVTAFTAIGKSAVNAFEESRKVSAQTEAVLRSTGDAANVTADGVANLANQISKKTGVDDEAIQSGENLLLTFTNIQNAADGSNDVFDRTTKVMVDMSAAMGQDASTSAIQLGKALNNPTEGLTALTRVGVTFSDGQKELIRTMQQTGDIAGAQGVILAELEKEFGGSAEAQATATDKMRVAFDNLQESIGGTLAPMIDKAASALTALTNGFSALPGPLQTGIVAVGALAAGFVVAAKVVDTFSAASDSLRGVLGLVRSETAATTAAIEAQTAATEANTVATEASAGALGAAGLALGALALAGAAVYGTYQMMHDAMVTVDVDTQQMARNTNDQLVQAWQWASENAKKFNLDLDDFAAKVSTNIGVATRMADALDAQGLSSEKLRAAIVAQQEADQRRAETTEIGRKATEVATLTTDGLNEALKRLAAGQKASNDQIEAAAAPWQNYTKWVANATERFDAYVKQHNAVQNAEEAFYEAVSNTSEAVAKNGRTLNTWTADGRATMKTLDALVTSAGEWLGAIVESGGGAAQWQASHVQIRNQIIQTMTQLGFGKAEIISYVNTYLAGVRKMMDTAQQWKNYYDQLDAMQGAAIDTSKQNWTDFGNDVKDITNDSYNKLVAEIGKGTGKVAAAIGDSLGGGGAAGKAVDQAGDELSDKTKNAAHKITLSFEEQLQADQLALNAVVDEVWGNVALSMEEKLARIKKVVEDAAGILQIVPPLGEGNPNGVTAPAVNTLLNGATTQSGGNVTVNVFSPTVQNPVTANSLAYSIGKQAAVAFAGAA